MVAFGRNVKYFQQARKGETAAERHITLEQYRYADTCPTEDCLENTLDRLPTRLQIGDPTTSKAVGAA